MSFILGLAIGIFATGVVAHRWPSFFARVNEQGAAVVNDALDKVKK